VRDRLTRRRLPRQVMFSDSLITSKKVNLTPGGSNVSQLKTSTLQHTACEHEGTRQLLAFQIKPRDLATPIVQATMQYWDQPRQGPVESAPLSCTVKIPSCVIVTCAFSAAQSA
jgi:hypothetical protein